MSSALQEYHSYDKILEMILESNTNNPEIVLNEFNLILINNFGRLYFGLQMIFSLCLIWSSRFEFLYMPVFIYAVLLVNTLSSFIDQLLPAFFEHHQHAIQFRLMIFIFRYFFLIVQLFYLFMGKFPAPTNTQLENRYNYLKCILLQLIYPMMSLLVICSYMFQTSVNIPTADCIMLFLNVTPLIDLLITCFVLRGVFFRRVLYRRVSCQCVPVVDDTQTVVNKIARSTISTSATIASVNL
ncbi:unnamed protein product [Caenorhabditis angaria]|uniref:Uncharacterized protein n=1 Tax=Caenorhabditis angaria TaxID=860376 RepID=A0A9P1N5B4_9PELO|nr:unnamed protein product [Caenorhabditis angaria]